MKTKTFLRTGLLLLCTACMISCNDDEENRWYDSMPDGGPFYEGHVLRFFYVDEEGNDLIEPTDLSTLPISTIEETVPEAPESLSSGLQYNNKLNSIVYNEDKKLYQFFSFAYGDSRYSSYTFYVYHKGKADRMDVTFEYQSKKVNAGQDYLAMATSWKVNGEVIWTDKEKVYRKYIYLVKKQDGTTSVVFD